MSALPAEPWLRLLGRLNTALIPMNSLLSYVTQLNRKPTAVLNVFIPSWRLFNETGLLLPCNWKQQELALLRSDCRPVFAERRWRGDMCCWQCWFFSPCPRLSQTLIRPLWLSPAGACFCIWKMWYGARAPALSSSLFSGEAAAERTPHTHRAWEASVCLERWACLLLGVCVCVFVRVGKERVAFPHRRLGLGMASTKILSFLLLIRGEPSLYFGPNHLQRKPQENASLRFLNTVSDQFLLTQTCWYAL